MYLITIFYLLRTYYVYVLGNTELNKKNQLPPLQSLQFIFSKRGSQAANNNGGFT